MGREAAFPASPMRCAWLPIDDQRSSTGWHSRTVIEAARRAAGLSQRRLAEIARTQQSSISEYESRRKSPTLEVVERLLDAADAELAVKPMVFFDVRRGSRGRARSGCRTGCGRCRSRSASPGCRCCKYVFPAEVTRAGRTSYVGPVRDEQRIDYYELVLRTRHGQDGRGLGRWGPADPGLAGDESARGGPRGLATAHRRGHEASHGPPPLDPGGVSAGLPGRSSSDGRYRNGRRRRRS